MKLKIALGLVFTLAAVQMPLWAMERDSYRAVESEELADFSKDGHEFVFSDLESGELWLYDLTANQSRQLVSLKSQNSDAQSVRLLNPRFSPTGGPTVYISVDEAQKKPLKGIVWSLESSGGQFRNLGSIYFDPQDEVIEPGSLFTFLPKGKKIILKNFEPAKKTASIFALDLVSGEWQPFMWQKGVLSYRWSRDQQYLAYLSERELPISSSKDPENPLNFDTNTKMFNGDVYDLWVTRSDGGQLKKIDDHAYYSRQLAGIPLQWSPDSKRLAFFSAHEVDSGKSSWELKVRKTAENKSFVVYTTAGAPLSSLYWSADQSLLAFLESAPNLPLQTEEDIAKASVNAGPRLVSLDLKTRKTGAIEGRDAQILPLPEGSVLLGWDVKDLDFVYLLHPEKSKNTLYYSLVRQHRAKEKSSLPLVRYIPPQVYHHFDATKKQLVLCSPTAACQIIHLPGGEMQWLTPNYSTTVGAGDFLVKVGEYAEAQKLYASLDERRMERNLWISLMVRRYVAYRLNDKAETATKLWSLIIDRINKGETPAVDYLLAGDVLAELKEGRLALDVFQKVLDLYPENAEAREALLKKGLIYKELGEYEFGKNSFAHFAKLFPDDQKAPIALVELGESLLLLDQPAVALKVFRKLIGLVQDPEIVVRAYLGKGKALEKMNRFKEAKKAYELIMEQVQGEKANHEPVDPRYLDEARRLLVALDQNR